MLQVPVQGLHMSRQWLLESEWELLRPRRYHLTLHKLVLHGGTVFILSANPSQTAATDVTNRSRAVEEISGAPARRQHFAFEYSNAEHARPTSATALRKLAIICVYLLSLGEMILRAYKIERTVTRTEKVNNTEAIPVHLQKQGKNFRNQNLHTLRVPILC